MKYDPVSSARDEKKNQYISIVSFDINKDPTEVDQVYGPGIYLFERNPILH